MSGRRNGIQIASENTKWRLKYVNVPVFCSSVCWGCGTLQKKINNNNEYERPRVLCWLAAPAYCGTLPYFVRETKAKLLHWNDAPSPSHTSPTNNKIMKQLIRKGRPNNNWTKKKLVSCALRARAVLLCTVTQLLGELLWQLRSVTIHLPALLVTHTRRSSPPLMLQWPLLPYQLFDARDHTRSRLLEGNDTRYVYTHTWPPYVLTYSVGVRRPRVVDKDFILFLVSSFTCWMPTINGGLWSIGES